MMTERKRRKVHVRVPITVGDYVYGPDEEDNFYIRPYYYQIQATFGMPNRYGHPDIELLINFDAPEARFSLLDGLKKIVEEGGKLTPGDRLEVALPTPWPTDPVAIRITESATVNPYGPCLRAVVEGMEEAYQAMDVDDALTYMKTKGRLIDPYANF